MPSTRRKTAGDLLLLFILLIPAWAPLTRPGLPRWLPGALPVFRLYARERGGAFDAGWALDSGFVYVAARAFRFLGLDGVTALKMSLALGMALLGFVVWLWARRLWGPRAGALAALLALYTPIFLSGLYILGGIALPWFMLGLAMVGLGIRSRGWKGWGVALVGAGLAALNASFLFKTPLAFTRISLYQLIEAPWFWGTNSVNLTTDPAWSLGLPLLALGMMALWLGWQRENDQLSVISYQWGVGVALLVGALVAPGDLALALILAASLPLAVAASGLLTLTPALKRPAVWAALLILPVLAAGPALSPDFQAYPIPERPAGVFGASHILLIDAGMAAPPAPDRTLSLDAVWQATQPIDFDYNIFIHVTDDAGNIVTQLDGQPLNDHPMTAWQTGEVLPAHYELTIPSDAPPSLHVRLGLYNWQTGARLPLASGGDALTIGN
ncbi:MAG TPA: hypothetical protein G4O05_03470 [Caldilineae bacterium]|nr:hypothetical protein [Caldilineae bacterium]